MKTKYLIKQVLVSFLIFMSVSSSLFGAFENNQFTVDDLNGSTFYQVEFDIENGVWLNRNVILFDTEQAHYINDSVLSDFNYTVDDNGYIVRRFDDLNTDFYLKIFDQNDSMIQVCSESNLTTIVNCQEGVYWFFNQEEAQNFLTVNNQETDQGNNQSTISGNIILPDGISLSDPQDCFDENNNTKAECNGIFIDLIDTSNVNWGTAFLLSNSGNHYELFLPHVDENETKQLNLQIRPIINHNTYYYDFTTNQIVTNINNTTPLSITQASYSNKIIDLNMTDFDFSTNSQDQGGEANSSLTDQITALQNEYSNMDLVGDDRTNVENMFSQINGLVEDGIIDDEATQIQSLIDQINQILHPDSTNGNQGQNNGQGENSSTIRGTVILPQNITLSSTQECQNNTFCNKIDIELFSKQDGTWLGNANVNPDGSYILHFGGLDINDSIDVVVNIIMDIDGIHESFFLDFGDDYAINGNNENRDTYKGYNEVEWIEQSNGPMLPQVNPLHIESSQTTLDMDLNDLDSDKWIVSGSVILSEDFVPGAILDDNQEQIGVKTVAITAISMTTGKRYRTYISRIGTNNSYPFKLKIPKDDSNCSIYIEKITGNENGNDQREELYLKDGGDHQFSDDDVFVSSNGIDWIARGNDMSIPNPDKVGYFIVDTSINNIDIDISNFGNNFYVIEGNITVPANFNLNDNSNNLYIEIIDAKTGAWVTSVPVMCSDDGCSYSLNLGTNESSADGYFMRLNQSHWDENHPENSWWRGYFINGEDFVDEMDVSYEEKTDQDRGNNYWVPANIDAITLTETVTIRNINFASYTPPVSYTITGHISELPDNINWINIRIYNPVTYNGNDAQIDENGQFTFKNIKEGKYILQIDYDATDDNDVRHSYHYIVSNQNRAVNSMDVTWIPYDENGTSLESHLYDDTLENEKYWAPKENNGEQFIFDITDDLSVGDISIYQPTLYDLNLSLSNLGTNKSININIYVPNEPIGQFKTITSDANGLASVVFRDLKLRDDYQMEIYIEGIGTYFYDSDTNSLKSDVYWIGKQNDSVCDDWKNSLYTCTDTDPISWEPNINGFSINDDLNLSLELPNDRHSINAVLKLGNEYANKNIDFFIDSWQQTDDNAWKSSEFDTVWDNFQADSSGNVNIALSVKYKSNIKYRASIYISDMKEGYVFDLGSDQQINGNDDSLITDQNSWSSSNDVWGPKSSTLFELNSDLDFGELQPPTLRTISFNVENLEHNEEIFISLEKIDSDEWYTESNIDWTTSPETYNNTVSIKVPDGNYRVIINPQEHPGGLINDGNNSGNDVLSNDSNITHFVWDWDRADKVEISSNQSYTISLPSNEDLKSISGTVNLGDENIEAGWIQAWNDNDQRSAEVNDDGTFQIKGLQAGIYTLEYWGWNGDDFITVQDVNISNNVTDYQLQKPTELVTISGTVINNSAGDNKQIYVLLLDVNDNNTTWDVIKDTNSSLSNKQNHDYNFDVVPAINGHKYAVCVGTRDRNETTGETTFTRYKATVPVDDNNSGTAIILTGINNDTNKVSLSVTKN